MIRASTFPIQRLHGAPIPIQLYVNQLAVLRASARWFSLRVPAASETCRHYRTSSQGRHVRVSMPCTVFNSSSSLMYPSLECSFESILPLSDIRCVLREYRHIAGSRTQGMKGRPLRAATKIRAAHPCFEMAHTLTYFFAVPAAPAPPSQSRVPRDLLTPLQRLSLGLRARRHGCGCDLPVVFSR